MESHKKYLDYLKSIPEKEAILDLQRLKASPTSSSSTLAAIQQKLSSSQRPSDSLMMRALSHSTHSILELELNMRYPNAYPTLVPIDVNLISLEPLLSTTERFSVDYGTVFYDCAEERCPLPADGRVERPHGRQKPRVQPLSQAREDNWAKLQDQSVNPRTFSYFRDQFSILENVNFSRWTSVPVENAIASGALLRYFKIDHPFFGFFDADLFLRDLAQYRSPFCSVFLVNALLLFACVSLPPSVSHAPC